MKKFLTSDYVEQGTYFSRPDLANLPFAIKNTPNFCLWKYGNPVNGKSPKIPYRYDAYKRTILKGMGDYKTNLIFSYDHYTTLKAFGVISDKFFLGFSLLNSDLSVIDIDDYQVHPVLDRLLASLYQKGCYIEVSPSRQGIHVFYKGSLDWSYSKNRGSETIGCTEHERRTSCEVYSCQDKRFITLTGEALSHSSEPRPDFLPDAEAIEDELRELGKLFFSPGVKRLPVDVSSNLVAQQIKPILEERETLLRLTPVLRQVLESIEHSRHAATFQKLCSERHPEGYLSPSEADMAFAGYMARTLPLLDKPLPREDQVRIICMAFKHRFERTKSQERPAYINATASEALDNARLYARSKQRIRKNTVNAGIMSESPQAPGLNTVQAGVKRQAPKSAIIKVPSAMQIFHLGRSIKNHAYSYEKPGNELMVHMPQSLNQTDFKYFAELLFQYVDSVKSLKHLSREEVKKELLPVNISGLLKSMGVSSKGQNYKRFLTSLRKLNCIVVQSKIIIDKEGRDSEEDGTSLIDYKYKKRESEASKSTKRQLRVRMHPTIIDMALDAQYNYALLNKNSYHSLHSDKSKLLYYHFCLSTLPGGHPVTFSIEELLKLWPTPAKIRNTKYKRKQELLALLENMINQIHQGYILDLSVQPKYSDSGRLESVAVKKYQLRLI